MIKIKKSKTETLILFFILNFEHFYFDIV